MADQGMMASMLEKMGTKRKKDEDPMSKSTLYATMRRATTALVLGALVGACSFAVAANDKKEAGGNQNKQQGGERNANPPAKAPGGGGGGHAGGGGNAGGGGGAHPNATNPPRNNPTTNSGVPRGNPPSGTLQNNPPAAGGGAHTTTNTENRPTTNANPRTTTTTTPIAPAGGEMRGNTTTNGNARTMPGNGNGGARPGGAPFNGGGNSGHVGTVMPRGVTTRTIANGNTVNVRANGRVRDVHDVRTGMDVHHNLNGNSRIFVQRPDHSRIFVERGRPGFVERPFSFRGHDFARRTYYYNGRAYSRFYRGWGFRGLFLNIYAPSFYFGPGFYGWAYNPWRTPIAFSWGWRARPWYGYYGGYFQPYPMYPSAAFWLTDYMISMDLEAAYQAHQDAGEMDGGPYAPGGPVGLTPDVKQQIADEVRNQLALENQEAQQNAQQQDIDPGSSGIARMLGDGRPHVFVAGAPLDLVDESGQECGISDGDVLGLQGATDPNAVAVSLVVLASKGGQECPKGDVVAVQLTDLQEMQNHMRETIDQGLQDLQSKQGAGGIPQAPPAAQAPTTPAMYAPIAPPPDPNAGQEIQQEIQQGTQVDQSAQTY